MKQLIIILTLCVLINFEGKSQGLTKNATGESSILFKGNQVSLDVAAAKISFGINNLQNSFGEKCKFIWGVNANGKNESGLAGVFSSGTLASDANINSFIGLSNSNSIPVALNNRLKKELETYNSLLESLDGKVTTLIVNSIKKNTTDTDLSDLQNQLLKDLSNSSTQGVFIKGLESFKSQSKIDLIMKKEKAAVKSIKADGDIIIKMVKNESLKIISSINETEKKINDQPFKQSMFFLTAGAGGSSFKLFSKFNSPLDASFIDTTFTARYIGLGANFQFRNNMIGIMYKVALRNNLSSLKDKTYTLKKTVDKDNQTLTEESKITAYSIEKTPYAEVMVNELNFDWVLRRRLDKDAKNFLIINPYLSAQIFSKNDSLLPNTANVGCGVYYFKEDGKFLGGFYLESPDIFQAKEKLKPALSQELLPIQKRIVIGVTAQISIGSFLNIF